MASRAEVANAAVSLLGDEIISRVPSREEVGGGELDPRRFTDNEIFVGTTYYIHTDSYLTSTRWSWTKRREPLARLADEPTSGYRYVYSLPSNQLGGPTALYSAGRPRFPQTDGWLLISDRIETDLDSPVLEYHQRVAEEVWPTEFVDAVVLLLASRWAYYFTDQANLTAVYRQDGEAAMREARRIDAQAQPSKRLRRFSLVDARFQRGAGQRRIA